HVKHTISATSSPSTRSGSLDITSSSVFSYDSSPPAPLPGRLSEDSGNRIQRFSFLSAIAAGTDSILNPTPQPAPTTPEAAFPAILVCLAAAAPLLSSVTVRIAPPALIMALAAKEAVHPGHRLLSDEKVGLGSILGWNQQEWDGRREAREGRWWGHMPTCRKQ
ncbi:hypothetical protein B0H14DRAFT_3599902, partial [Mycena olivaceomarginata]